MEREDGAHAEKRRDQVLEERDLFVGEAEARETLIVVRPVRGEELFLPEGAAHERERRVAENAGEQQDRDEGRDTHALPDDRQDGEYVSDEGAPHISHEDARGRKIETQKSER